MTPRESPNALSDERVNQEPEGDEHHEQDRQSREGGGRAFANHVTDLLERRCQSDITLKASPVNTVEAGRKVPYVDWV